MSRSWVIRIFTTISGSVCSQGVLGAPPELSRVGDRHACRRQMHYQAPPLTSLYGAVSWPTTRSYQRAQYPPSHRGRSLHRRADDQTDCQPMVGAFGTSDDSDAQWPLLLLLNVEGMPVKYRSAGVNSRSLAEDSPRFCAPLPTASRRAKGSVRSANGEASHERGSTPIDRLTLTSFRSRIWLEKSLRTGRLPKSSSCRLELWEHIPSATFPDALNAREPFLH
jgi:hypothetical protein